MSLSTLLLGTANTARDGSQMPPFVGVALLTFLALLHSTPKGCMEDLYNKSQVPWLAPICLQCCCHDLQSRDRSLSAGT